MLSMYIIIILYLYIIIIDILLLSIYVLYSNVTYIYPVSCLVEIKCFIKFVDRSLFSLCDDNNKFRKIMSADNPVFASTIIIISLSFFYYL